MRRIDGSADGYLLHCTLFSCTYGDTFNCQPTFVLTPTTHTYILISGNFNIDKKRWENTTEIGPYPNTHIIYCVVQINTIEYVRCALFKFFPCSYEKSVGFPCFSMNWRSNKKRDREEERKIETLLHNNCLMQHTDSIIIIRHERNYYYYFYIYTVYPVLRSVRCTTFSSIYTIMHITYDQANYTDSSCGDCGKHPHIL